MRVNIQRRSSPRRRRRTLVVTHDTSATHRAPESRGEISSVGLTNHRRRRVRRRWSSVPGTDQIIPEVTSVDSRFIACGFDGFPGVLGSTCSVQFLIFLNQLRISLEVSHTFSIAARRDEFLVSRTRALSVAVVSLSWPSFTINYPVW